MQKRERKSNHHLHCVPLCLFMAVFAVLFAVASPSAELSSDGDLAALRSWQAGRTVSAASVEAFGSQRCFVSEPIPEPVWQRMQGKSYQPNPYVKRTDLRYIKVLHWDYDGQIHTGEMVANKLIAEKLVAIFRQLYEARYPIERMVLPDNYNADDETQMRDNNSSCFCYRAVSGSKTLSKHARGLAVDINPLYNPYCKTLANGRRIVQPTTAAAYCDRAKKFRYKIERNDLCYKLFTQNGFRWGGAWRSCKDYQHFEYVR